MAALQNVSTNVMQSLFGSGHLMAKQCGGHVTIVYTDEKKNSIVYTNSDSIWNQLTEEGLKLQTFEQDSWCRRIDVMMDRKNNCSLRMRIPSVNEPADKHTSARVSGTSEMNDVSRQETTVNRIKRDITYTLASGIKEIKPVSRQKIPEDTDIRSNSSGITKMKDTPKNATAIKKDIAQSSSTAVTNNKLNDDSFAIKEEVHSPPAVVDEDSFSDVSGGIERVIADDQQMDIDWEQEVTDDEGASFEDDQEMDKDFEPSDQELTDETGLSDGPDHEMTSPHSTDQDEFQPKSKTPPRMKSQKYEKQSLNEFDMVSDNTCPVCKVTFDSKEIYTEHTTFEENTGAKKYPLRMCGTCGICQKPFNDHIDKEAGKRKFVCCQCKARSLSNISLKQHTNTHIAENRFLCNVCGKSFFTRHQLTGHTKYAHRAKESVTCTICGKVLKKASLKTHMNWHEGNYKHACTLCDRVFQLKFQLEQHQKYVHEGRSKPKLFKCNLCEKGFINGGKLKIHMNVHTGEKPYKCPICEKGFSQVGYVPKHLRLVHKQDLPKKH